MKNSNKSKGSKFEEDFAIALTNDGYWVHLVAGASHTGSQPCDLIAIRTGETYLIDCKTLENKTGAFPLNRVEENQRLAFEKYVKCKNNPQNFLLAILWNNSVYLVPFKNIDFNKKSYKIQDYELLIGDFYNENNCR